jgi:O-acetyl-ADP-ribose deacetylase (regulator of RNase III)
VWRGGGNGEEALLASCYRGSLAIADAEAFESVAFPAISTGIYGYPLADAAAVAVREVVAWLAAHQHPREVIFCTFDADATSVYLHALAAATTR